jgi:hypothetical protein
MIMPDTPESGNRPAPDPQSASPAGEAAAPEGGGNGGVPLMPTPTFTTFVLSLASSGLVQLGEVPDPGSGRTETNLVLAKHTIDLLSMIQEKIRTGLDAEESRLLEGLLYELRMKFVLKK